MGSSFGHLFRLSTFGESHGGAVGVVIDGCPPRLPLSVEEIQRDLDRRRPGQSKITTPRNEADRAEILSGLFEGQTLGTPIAIIVRNTDARPEAYENFKDTFRPSHADYTYEAKYGVRNWQGGGRASARETIGRVAAGAVARKLLTTTAQVEVLAYVKQIFTIVASVDPALVRLEDVEANIARCPDAASAEAMVARIDEARRAGDSLGGVVECVCRNVPPGLGEPVFDKLEAELARSVMSLPASKGFEIGSGFAGTQLTGIQHNDPFTTDASGRVRTTTNRSGGVQGGISNGEDIVFRVGFKPTATISQAQDTVDRGGNKVTLEAKGRHDPCVLPRAVPMVEAMACLVLADHLLRQRAQCGPDPAALPCAGTAGRGRAIRRSFHGRTARRGVQSSRPQRCARSARDAHTGALARAEVGSRAFGRAAPLLPIIGALIGGLLVAIEWVVGRHLPPQLDAVLLVGLWELFTRGHLRALAAVAPAATAAMLLAKAAAFWLLAPRGVGLLFAPLLGSWSIVVLAVGARDAANPNRKLAPAVLFNEFAVASLLTLALVFSVADGLGILLGVVAAALTVVLRVLLHRRIGGMSVRWVMLGSQLIEVATLWLLVALQRPAAPA
jgi:chorismate synthase